ncbi:MAG: NPCBM/NEW2 domain-containing protein [Pirellulales bacterium]
METQFTDLKFSTTNGGLSISGTLESNIETLAVIAYTDPPGRSGYNANTWVAEVTDGKFRLLADYHRPGDHSLRLTTVHANGATKTREFSYQVDKAGVPDADLLTSAWVVRPIEELYLQGNKRLAVEQAKAALKESPSEVTAAKLKHIVALNDPKDLIILSKTISKHVPLSDASWEEAQVGWGEPARDQYFNNQRINSNLLFELGGKFFAKGLYAHLPSNYAFNLDGKWKEFKATVGMHAGAEGQGTSVFIVKGDGKELYRTKLLKDLKTESISVSVQGVKKLEPIAESGVEGNAVCWSIWRAPVVSR